MPEKYKPRQHPVPPRVLQRVQDARREERKGEAGRIHVGKAGRNEKPRNRIDQHRHLELVVEIVGELPCSLGPSRIVDGHHLQPHLAAPCGGHAGAQGQQAHDQGERHMTQQGDDQRLRGRHQPILW